MRSCAPYLHRIAALFVAAPLLTLAPMQTAQAIPAGILSTMPLGKYICERTGDATGAASLRVEEADFTIVPQSSYRTQQGLGTYFLTDDNLLMTSGPLSGLAYKQISPGFVRLIDNEKRETDLRCVRQVR